MAGQKDLQYVALSWGYLEVTQDNVTVLAETAEPAAEINVERAKEALSRAQKAMVEKDMDQARFKKYQLKLQRAAIRVQLSENSGKSN